MDFSDFSPADYAQSSADDAKRLAEENCEHLKRIEKALAAAGIVVPEKPKAKPAENLADTLSRYYSKAFIEGLSR